MTMTISFGWWLAPAIFTAAIFLLVLLRGPKMSKDRGGMFPDALGAMLEVASYVLAALLSIIAWLIWWGLR